MSSSGQHPEADEVRNWDAEAREWALGIRQAGEEDGDVIGNQNGVIEHIGRWRDWYDGQSQSELQSNEGNTSIHSGSNANTNDLYGPSMIPAEIIAMHQHEDSPSNGSSRGLGPNTLSAIEDRSIFSEDYAGIGLHDAYEGLRALSDSDEEHDEELWHRHGRTAPLYSPSVPDVTVYAWDQFAGFTNDPAMAVVDWVGRVLNQYPEAERRSIEMNAYGVVLDYVLHGERYIRAGCPRWHMDLATGVMEILESSLSSRERQERRAEVYRIWQEAAADDSEQRWLISGALSDVEED